MGITILSATLATLPLLNMAPRLPEMAQDTETSPLIGTWQVDLRPTPDAEPYYQQLVVGATEEGLLAGTFYGAPFRHAHLNDDWNETYFSFVTNDGSGEYHTTCVLRGGRLEGTTHSIGREFLLPWRAIPAYEPQLLSADAALDDIALLKLALDTVHPGAVRYIDQETLDAAFERLRAAVADGTTVCDFYRDLSLAVAELRCGHTRVETPEALTNYRDRVPTHLPFRFRLFDGRMIVDAVHPSVTTLQRGCEVLAINGVSVRDLLDMIAPTVLVDGMTDSIRASRLDTAYEFSDTGFEHFLPLFVDFRDDFTLQLAPASPDRPTTVTVRAITASESRGMAAAGPSNFADSIRTETLDDTTVLLEVGSFINYRNTVDPV
ncbi:MAG: hypothetical protein KC983_08795, partial [Phycisphaerales bacterium]|nr:hypothetical protein [Phycisphaerales bacterium]